MARKAFYSFHYVPDNWRASQVRNMGVIEKNPLASSNRWEEIKRQGDSAIKKWIDTNQKGRSIVIVLIGANTAGRKWIKYEIEKGWNDNRALLGINIHNLLNRYGEKSSKGRNPFGDFTVGTKRLSSIARAYDPPYTKSTSVYKYINENLADWIEEAIEIRKNN
jgi:hypothetical protein